MFDNGREGGRGCRKCLAGIPIFVCEQALINATDVYKNVKLEGFMAYVPIISLSRLTTTPPDFGAACPKEQVNDIPEGPLLSN